MRIFEAYDMLALEGVMRAGDVYVEIGAHHGQFFRASGVFMLAASRGGRYHFYEPSAKARIELKGVVDAMWKLSEINDIVIFSEAVWSSSGAFTYHVDASEGQGNTLASGVHPAKSMVTAITLEEVIRRAGGPVRFLAMNAEQAEYEILRSPAMACVEFCTVEFHPGKSGIDTRAFIAEHLPTWEILEFGRESDAYNQVLMVNRG